MCLSKLNYRWAYLYVANRQCVNDCDHRSPCIPVVPLQLNAFLAYEVKVKVINICIWKCLRSENAET